MRNQRFCLVRALLLLSLSFLLTTTACHNPVLQKPSTSIGQSAISSECRIIRHRLGEACIPIRPQRIIALDVPAILDSLLSLGIKPVGTAIDDWGGRRYFPALLPEMIVGIESVGAEGSPSLEKIFKLKPDLILLPDYSAQNYRQLSNIAPTVLIDIFNVKASIKANFRYIAQLVGQEEKAANVLNQYQRRVKEFQEQLGSRLKGAEVSVISHYNNRFGTLASRASIFQVFKDVGIPIKPIFLKQEEWFDFSIEVIHRYDADILFFIEDVTGSASFLSKNPLILSLESVKNGQAYIVSPIIWTFYGPIGMNLLLDDLSKYLLGEAQSPFL